MIGLAVSLLLVDVEGRSTCTISHLSNDSPIWLGVLTSESQWFKVKILRAC